MIKPKIWTPTVAVAALSLAIAGCGFGEAAQRPEKPSAKLKASAETSGKGDTCPKAVEAFLSFVERDGTVEEKAAADHLVKIRGAGADPDGRFCFTLGIGVDVVTDLGTGDADRKVASQLADVFRDWLAAESGPEGTVFYRVSGRDGSLLRVGIFQPVADDPVPMHPVESGSEAGVDSNPPRMV